jgi:hypothetical protein
VFGRPHVYETPFNEGKDDYEDFLVVSPIEPQLLGLVLEDWDIWNRWAEAFDGGQNLAKLIERFRKIESAPTSLRA